MAGKQEPSDEPAEKKPRSLKAGTGAGSQISASLSRQLFDARKILSDVPTLTSAQDILGTMNARSILESAGLTNLQDIMRPVMQNYRDIVNGPMQEIMRSQFGPTGAITEMLSQIRTLDLSRPSIHSLPSHNTAYSDDFTSPDDYFSPHEIVIDSFDELHKVIQSLIRRNPTLEFLWRGQQDASWGLHSSLYRRLMQKQKVRPADKKHRVEEPYPTEDDMVEAEEAILKLARVDWRFDDLSALETFARLQHFGAPTRLIDVSRNPFIAAWFAVEASSLHDKSDGRLFATATFPVLPLEKQQEAENLTQVRGELARTYLPFWHLAKSPEDRAEIEWGTGTIRRFWVPPLYEQRILAQNGCFLLDGVPIGVQQNAGYFKRKGEGNRSWRKADLLASGSIFTKLYDPARAVRTNKKRAFPPTFTFRITAEAKDEIRRVLEERFSYSASTMYPDIEGLAKHLHSHLDEIVVSIPASS